MALNHEMSSLLKEIKKEYENKDNNAVFDKIFLLFLDNIFTVDTKQWKYEQYVISQLEIDNAVKFATGTNKEAGA